MTRKHLHPPHLHARLWVEAGGRIALTEAAADLLEQIEACGSLSAAARKLRFSYRRAWLLLDSMNHAWSAGKGGARRHVARTAIGGNRGGGARLTPFGRQLLAAYRAAQLHLEFTLSRQQTPFRQSLRHT